MRFSGHALENHNDHCDESIFAFLFFPPDALLRFLFVQAIGVAAGFTNPVVSGF